jgi:hypothetical protein
MHKLQKHLMTMQRQITLDMKMFKHWCCKQQLDQAKLALTNAAANLKQANICR